MSIFNWFTSAARRSATRPAMPEGAVAEAKARQSSRRAERHARRELLHQTVRECMVRAGVLSTAYKFKVLALDQRGRQFMVMIDVAGPHGGDTARLAEIEALIAQAAHARHGITVAAVYWRISEHVAQGRPEPFSKTVPVDVSGWLPHEPAASQPAAQARPAVAVAPSAAGSAAIAMVEPVRKPAQATPGQAGFDPLQADEVAAFQQALAAATSTPAQKPQAEPQGAPPPARPGPRSYTLLTGYEDTEVEDADFQNDALGGTQYGALN